MYYSRITLDLAKLPPGRLKELITKGSYALHQWVWLLFTDDETRKFLFREEEGQGFLRFYVLSENAPTKNDLFQIETKEFKPKLRKGDRLIFSLRANPTVCRKGRRYDLFMDLKKRVPQLERQDLLILQQAEAAEWLKRQGTGAGFFPNFIKMWRVIKGSVCMGKRRPNHILYHGFFRSFRDL